MTAEPESRAPHLARGVLDMCVLALLALEPTHTYALVVRLHERGFADVGYGTLYPLVTRLRRQGFLEQQSTPGTGGPPRRILTVTPAGHDALQRWRRDWDEVVAAAGSVLARLDHEAGRD